MSRAENGNNGGTRWLCKCDCGKDVIVLASNLVRGLSKSCGCYAKDHPSQLKHGMRHTRIYKTWCGIKYRCNNPNAYGYENYGGRGIRVCDEWEEFEPFYKWAMENGYSDDLSIDRIDVNGNYEPSNCRWVDDKTQANNMRTNIRFEYEGKSMTVAEIADTTGASRKLLYSRLEAGYSIEDSLKYASGEIPRDPPNSYFITWNGKTLNRAQWARELGMTESCLRHRLVVAKWSVEKAFTTPVIVRTKKVSA